MKLYKISILILLIAGLFKANAQCYPDRHLDRVCRLPRDGRGRFGGQLRRSLAHDAVQHVDRTNLQLRSVRRLGHDTDLADRLGHVAQVRRRVDHDAVVADAARIHRCNVEAANLGAQLD